MAPVHRIMYCQVIAAMIVTYGILFFSIQAISGIDVAFVVFTRITVIMSVSLVVVILALSVVDWVRRRL